MNLSVTAVSALLALWCALGVWRFRPRRANVVKRFASSAAAPRTAARRPRFLWPSRRTQPSVLAEAATIVELLRVASASGAGVRGSVLAVAEHVPEGLDALGPGFRRVEASLRRGRPLDAVLEAWADDAPAAVGELTRLLRSADVTGAGLAEPLERLGADLRRRRRRDLESRARRLPVTMLVPLVVCVLPAFMALTVVPMLAVGLDALRLAQ